MEYLHAPKWEDFTPETIDPACIFVTETLFLTVLVWFVISRFYLCNFLTEASLLYFGQSQVSAEREREKERA